MKSGSNTALHGAAYLIDELALSALASSVCGIALESRIATGDACLSSSRICDQRHTSSDGGTSIVDKVT